MPSRVPCYCTEYQHQGVISTKQCNECNALELLGLTRSDVEHLPLLYASNRALSERCVNLEKTRDFALKKERETRRVAGTYLGEKRKFVYALREAGIDEHAAAVLARMYEDRHEAKESSASD
jgi:hypothetical protein